MKNKQLELSVVVPLLDEEGNLAVLYEEITQVLNGKFDYEIIFVDDGSRDSSLDILEDIARNDPRVQVLVFRRNFGQTAALSAGFHHANGKLIAALDADLQNDPKDIPAMIDKLNQGYDIVSGWRKDRKDNHLRRNLPSRLANWLIKKITNVPIHDSGCTLKVYKAEVLRETRLYGEMHRFIPALAQWSGANVGEMVVNHRKRMSGKAKYGLNRTFKVLLDLITVKFLNSFSTKPLYIFGLLGGVSLIGSGISFIALLYHKFVMGLSMNRNPLLIISAMLFMATIQFIMMGLLAELQVRTYHESQNRPTYVLRKTIHYKKDDKD